MCNNIIKHLLLTVLKLQSPVACERYVTRAHQSPKNCAGLHASLANLLNCCYWKIHIFHPLMCVVFVFISGHGVGRESSSALGKVG